MNYHLEHHPDWPSVPIFRDDCDADPDDAASVNCQVCHKQLLSAAATQQHWRICVKSWPGCSVKLKRLTDKQLLACKTPEYIEDHQGHECTPYGESCTTAENLESHVKLHSKLKCVFNTCSLIFSSPEELQRHSKIHCQALRVSCVPCGASFKELFELEQHLQQHNQDEVHARTTFNYASSSELPITKHKETATISLLQQIPVVRDNPSICQMCGKDLGSCELLKKHKAQHNTNTPGILKCLHWKCHHLFFHSADELREHSKAIHNNFKPTACHDRQYICSKCVLTFKSATDLQEHHSRMHFLRPFKCVYCGEGFQDKNNYDEHLEKHKSQTSDLFKCLIVGCQATFSLSQDLTFHTIRHQATCDIPSCLFISTSQKDLKIHKGFVHSIWLNKCHMCNKGFTGEENLRRHLQAHNTDGKGVFKCLKTRCHQTFSDPSDLMKHTMKQICWGSMHKCDVPFCQFATDLKVKLRVHKEHVHSIWLHNCQVCGKGFKRLIDHKQHMKSHDAVGKEVDFSDCDQTFRPAKESDCRYLGSSLPVQRPLACDFPACNYDFKSQQELEDHRIKMHSLKLWACQFCREEFDNFLELLRHVKDQHIVTQQTAEDQPCQNSTSTAAQYVLVCKDEIIEDVDSSLN